MLVFCSFKFKSHIKFIEHPRREVGWGWFTFCCSITTARSPVKYKISNSLVDAFVSFIVSMSFHAFRVEKDTGFLGQADYQRSWLWRPFGVHPAQYEGGTGTAVKGTCLDGAISHCYQPLPHETEMNEKAYMGRFHILSFIVKYILEVFPNVYVNLTEL